MSSWTGNRTHFREKKTKFQIPIVNTTEHIAKNDIVSDINTNPSKYVIPIDNVQPSAICAIALNEELYIDEWIQYNIFLGFSHIYIYDNSENNSLKNTSSEKVTIIHFPGRVKQLEAYTHFTFNYKNKYKWGAFIDCDEFIVLKKHNNINQLLLEYNSLSGLALNWIMFGTSNKIYYENEPVTSRFRYCSREINNHIKCILQLKYIDTFITPHFATLKSNKIVDTNNNVINSSFNESGDSSIACIHHYYTKSEEEFIKKIERGRADIMEKRKQEELVNLHLKNNDVYNSDAWDFYSSHLKQQPS